MKIALAQINPTIGALRANSQKIVEFAEQARTGGAELVIFPELAICGYPPLDLVEKSDFVAAARAALQQASRQVPGITIVCGCVTCADAATGKSVHNSAIVIQDGKELFQQSKMLLPTYDVFDEARNFAPARQQKIWTFKGLRIALTICEDAWNDKEFWTRRGRQLYDRDPVCELLSQRADCLINISASPFSIGKMALREDMLGAIAREYNVPVVLVNQVGGNDQLVFDGTSLVIKPGGGIATRASSFEEDLLFIDTQSWAGKLEPPLQSETAAIFEALVLGTRDYVHKCGFQRVLLGLSGGIDSALTAVIAVHALGADKVLALAMPSRFSSAGSVNDARELARNLGVEFRVVPIEPARESLLSILRPQFEGRQDPPSAVDLTEQNIQSRIRGIILMGFSNRTGSLVLSTGNKSELATGYCTLYGDMAGGLAVISDVLKTQVYELSRYINATSSREVIPAAILEKPPSAELKPDQKDQDDLPPYEIVDVVVREYVEDYKTGEQIAAAHGLPIDVVQGLIRRIDHSEYKRQQAAPGLKISPKAFGMGRRFPIAQRYVSGSPTPEKDAQRAKILETV